nr:hypothetical protein [Hymenobacter sp. AT01-02]
MARFPLGYALDLLMGEAAPAAGTKAQALQLLGNLIIAVPLREPG